MRYTREHKHRTRQRIVAEASHAFRAEGIANVGVAELMGRLHLTHGGFYAHFASKDALVAEACSQELATGEAESVLGPGVVAPEQAVASLITHYLSPQHRDTPGLGCYLPSLASEVARCSPTVREAYTRAFRRFAGRLARNAPGETEQQRFDAAITLLTGMAGAVAVARAVAEPELSDHILRVCQAFYLRAFAPDSELPGTDAPDRDAAPTTLSETTEMTEMKRKG